MVERVRRTGLFRDKQVRLFLSMGNGGLKVVARTSGMTYNYALGVVARWIEIGLIDRQGSGYKYTVAGERLRKLLVVCAREGGIDV